MLPCHVEAAATPIKPTNKTINTEIKINDKYDLGRELGKSSVGAIVYHCTDLETKEQFACKSIAKQGRTAENIDEFRQEAIVMSQLPQHPNIVKFVDAFEDEISIHIVMELCDGGDLMDRINSHGGPYSEQEAAQVIHTIMEAVQACHSKGIMHRDLKPENILFTSKGELKLADFGSAVYFKPKERFTKIFGTIAYVAPEVLNKNYGPEADIWSVGVILYLLLSRSYPFQGRNEQAMMREVLTSHPNLDRDPWPKVSDSAKMLLRNDLLVRQPQYRSTANEVLNHPWLQNNKDNKS